MNNEKKWYLLGVLLGILVIVAGIIFMATPAKAYGGSTPEYASFGADYYTYQYDATRDVASNVRVVTEAVNELSASVSLYAGAAFVVAGLLILLSNGKKLAMLKAETAPVFIPFEPEQEAEIEVEEGTAE